MDKSGSTIDEEVAEDLIVAVEKIILSLSNT
jgi:hypothetical protein